MATFTAEVFQNEYLPEGATEVHAIVAVQCDGAGAAGQGGDAAEIVIIDSSGSMEHPTAKMRSARQAAKVAVDEILDGTWFAIIAGSNTAALVYPENSSKGAMVRMTATARGQAKRAIDRVRGSGGTAIGSWINAAIAVFQSVPAAQRHAILLTDGKNESEDPALLGHAIDAARGVFQCDCRGVGQDWVVDELRGISNALLGTVDLIAEPAHMEEDFERMMKVAMSRGIADLKLRVWAPQGAEVLFVRQVAPTIEELTSRGVAISPLITEFPTGAWGDESREYHVAIRVAAKPVGSEQLAARLQYMVNDEMVSQGLVKALWSGDEALTTRINPAVAHYTGQTELAAEIQAGLAAKAAGDDVTATLKLGRAAKLAAQTGNDEATTRLKKIIDIEDAETGTVRLKRNVEKLDEMALDTASTKTTRVR